jgi:hypothetical protein
MGENSAISLIINNSGSVPSVTKLKVSFDQSFETESNLFQLLVQPQAARVPGLVVPEVCYSPS